jgi:hypothetical protein
MKHKLFIYRTTKHAPLKQWMWKHLSEDHPAVHKALAGGIHEEN